MGYYSKYWILKVILYIKCFTIFGNRKGTLPVMNSLPNIKLIIKYLGCYAILSIQHFYTFTLGFGQFYMFYKDTMKALIFPSLNLWIWVLNWTFLFSFLLCLYLQHFSVISLLRELLKISPVLTQFFTMIILAVQDFKIATHLCYMSNIKQLLIIQLLLSHFTKSVFILSDCL